jgi:hypothetical protein
MSSRKDRRISIIMHMNSLILNLNLTRLSGWPTHESQEIDCKMADSGWIKLPFEKIMKK